VRVPRLDGARAGTSGGAVRIRIRARDVALATEAPRNLSILNVLRGRIVEMQEEAGPIVELRLDIDGQALLARVTRLSVATLGLTPGREIYALVKSVAFDRQSLGSGASTDAID